MNNVIATIIKFVTTGGDYAANQIKGVNNAATVATKGMATLATCDPVVPYENNKPCASDVVHGKVRVTATTAAYDGESRPTASSPFIASGIPKAERDVDFTTYAYMAERSCRLPLTT